MIGVETPTLRELAVQLASHLNDCYDVRIEANKKLDALTSKLDRIEQLPMRAVRWIASIVVVAAITTVTTNYLNSQAAAEKAAQAAQSAASAQATAVQTSHTTDKKLDAIIAHQNAGP